MGLLAPFFSQAAGKLAERSGEFVAEAALPKVKELYNRVRARLVPGSYQGALLDGVRAEPNDAGRQEILKAELAKLIAQDEDFAAEVQRLVDEAEKAGGVQLTASDVGVVAGRDVHQRGQYVAGRDMTVIGKEPRSRKPSGKVIAPIDGQQVPRSFTSKGILSGIPKDHFVWLAIQVNDLLWPKRQIAAISGESWVQQIYEGGTTRTFSLVLLLVNDEGQRSIENWVDQGETTGDWPGLAHIPGALQLDVAIDLTLA